MSSMTPVLVAVGLLLLYMIVAMFIAAIESDDIDGRM